MTSWDVAMTARASTNNTVIVAVHMDAINHCHEKRDMLRQRLEEQGIPADKVCAPAGIGILHRSIYRQLGMWCHPGCCRGVVSTLLTDLARECTVDTRSA